MTKVRLQAIVEMLCLYGCLMLTAAIVSALWYYFVYAEDLGKYYGHLAYLVLIMSCIAPGFITWFHGKLGRKSKKTTPQYKLALSDKLLNLGSNPFGGIEQPLKDIEAAVGRMTRPTRNKR